MSADVNKEGFVDVVTGPEYFTACTLIAMDWSKDYKLGCLLLSAQLAYTQATTVLFGQSIPFGLVKATLIWIQLTEANMANSLLKSMDS